MKLLNIAKGIEFPIDAVTQKLAFIGRSSSGKSYGAGKLAEELLEAGVQVVVLDPVGIWHGLRTSADGKWIVKEYNKLAKILIPEIREQEQARRKAKAKNIDEQMAKLLALKKCKCGGALEQRRAGTKICYCTICNTRYRANSGKKKKS